MQQVRTLSRALAALALITGAAAGVAGCGATDDEATTTGSASAAAPLAVAAAFYPIEEAARAVGGARVAVTNLTPPGGEPHDLELSAEAAGRLEQARVVLYLGNGFQPNVEKAIKALRTGAGVATDLLAGIDLRRNDAPVEGVRGKVDAGQLADRSDPHVWVDPGRFVQIVDGVQAALTRADPAGKGTYRANRDAYVAKLSALDYAFKATLSTCRSKTLVTSHAAFGYLADRYGLVQAPIAGISPENEPDPKSLAATARFAKANGVKTVFFESLVPKTLAETVAREIGAATDALDPIEGITAENLAKGQTYLTIQEKNLDAIAKGLGCTRA